MKPNSHWLKSPPLNWRAYPLVPLAVSLSLGIWLADLLRYHQVANGGWGLLAFTALMMGAASQQFSHQRYRNLAGFGIVLLFLLFGCWRAVDHHSPNHPAYFAGQLPAEQATNLLAEIDEIRPGEKSLRLVVSVKSIVSDTVVQPVAGKLLVYLPPNKRAAKLTIGNRIVVSAQPQLIRGPLNPYAFDGATYWSRKSVFYQVFIRDDSNWTPLKTSQSSLVATAESVRAAWLNSFIPYLSGDQLAVAAALILGKRDLLTDEISSAYADTGAVHVLAVSGLHVGIVAGIFLFLLRWLLPRRKWTRLTRTILTVAAIWGFAFVTGLSPSVQRSATMFSILLLGSLWRRKTYLLNTLAGAAIAMLIWNPQQLFQVGFQLSFAAVTGIALFLRPIQRSVFFPAAWQRSIWAVLSVSLAAQIGTLPLSIYYFHQLPLYFLLSGSMVILTAHAALILGLLHGFVALVLPAIKSGTAALLGGSVWLQNAIVFWSRKWPGAKQELDWIFSWEAALILLFILSLAAWVKWRSFYVLTGGLLLFLGVLGVRLQSSNALAKQQRLVIYHQSKSTLIDVVSGRRAVRINGPDSSPRTLSFTAGNHQSARRYSIAETWPIPEAELKKSLDGVAYQTGNWLDLFTGSLLVVDGEQISSALGRGNPKTLLLINSPRYVEVSKKVNLQGLETIILDGSNRYYVRKEWLEKQGELSAKITDLSIDGAFVLDKTHR